MKTKWFNSFTKRGSAYFSINSLRLTTVFLLLFFWTLNVNAQSGDSPPPPVAPSDPYESTYEVELHQGKITFTQAGKQTTWKVITNHASLDPSKKSIYLQYSPDGKEGVSWLFIDIKSKGSAFEVIRMGIEKGPAGSAEYNKKTAACKAHVTAFSAAGVEGSGTCTGGFKNGPAITSFQFSARP